MPYKDRVKRETYNKNYKKVNKEKLRSQGLLYTAKVDPKKKLNSTLKRVYNLTIEEYDTLYNSQEGCCAICKKHQTEFKRRLYVDHDHSTKKVRGLLCNNCNTSLGGFKDNIEYLKSAILYLKQNQSYATEGLR